MRKDEHLIGVLRGAKGPPRVRCIILSESLFGLRAKKYLKSKFRKACVFIVLTFITITCFRNTSVLTVRYSYDVRLQCIYKVNQV